MQKKPEERMKVKAWTLQVQKIRDCKNKVLLGATKRFGVARAWELPCSHCKLND